MVTIGRRATTVLGEVLIMAGSAGQLFFSWDGFSLGAIVFFRAIVGAGVGVCSVTKPMYIAELSPTHRRGFAGAAFALFWSVGVQMVFVLEVYFPAPGSPADTSYPVFREIWRFEVFLSASFLCTTRALNSGSRHRLSSGILGVEPCPPAPPAYLRAAAALWLPSQRNLPRGGSST